MEQFNRAAAQLAMFRWARDNGRGPEVADEMAKRFVYNTHYLIGKANIPQWAMGESGLAKIVGRNAILFRSFTHNFLLSMKRSLDPDAAGNRDYTTVLLSMAYISLFGGMLSMPFLDDIIEMIEKIIRKPLRSDARKMLYDANAGAFYNMFALGVPAQLGVDISGSMRINMPWGADDAVFGVWGGAYDKLKQGGKAMKAGDYYRAMENFSPMFISHPMRAYRGYKYPITTPSGQVMYDWKREKFQYTTLEALWRSLGFRPAREAVKQMDKRSKDVLLSAMKDVKNNILREYAIAHSKGDVAGKLKARKKGREWNKEVLKAGLGGKLGQMKKANFTRSLKKKIEGRKEELAD